MKYTFEVIGYIDDEKITIIKCDYTDLGEAIEDARMAFDYNADDYDKIVCKVTDKHSHKLLFCEHN